MLAFIILIIFTIIIIVIIFKIKIWLILFHSMFLSYVRTFPFHHEQAPSLRIELHAMLSK